MTKYVRADVLGPLEVLLGCPRSWTFCSYGPVTVWPIYFLWRGPTLILRQFPFAFSSLDMSWVLAQDQQESEEEEEEENEDLLGVWTYSYP